METMTENNQLQTAEQATIVEACEKLNNYVGAEEDSWASQYATETILDLAGGTVQYGEMVEDDEVVRRFVSISNNKMGDELVCENYRVDLTRNEVINVIADAVEDE